MKKMAILLSTIGLVPSAYAVPTAFPNGDWNLSGVKNPTTSIILADSDDSKQAWIMPPLAGDVATNGLKGASANTGFCGNMADLQTSSRELTQEISNVSLQLGPAAKNMRSKQDIYYKKLEEADSYLVSTPSIKQAVDLQTSIDGLNQRLDGNYDRMNKCGAADSAACQAILKETNDLQAEVKNETKTLNDLRKTVGNELKIYQQKQGLAETAKQDWLDSTKTLQTIREQLMEAHKELMEMYSYFSKLEGGYTTIDYDTGWDANANKLSQINPGFIFTKIPTQDVHVNASMIGAKDEDSYLSSLPIVLDYSVNGHPGLPYGPQNSDTLAAMPSRMSTTLRLSLLGACPMLNPGKFGLKMSETGFPAFGMSVSYSYPVAFRTKISFSYNLYKFYELIKSSGSSSGFFSSDSWSETSEKHLGHDAFSADWRESDPDNVTPEAEKRKVEAEVKAELMNRVLQQMATPVVSGSNSIPSAPAVPQHGALVIANGINETCGTWSYYCIGATWVLRGLDSIFGSSRTESTFKQTYDMTSSEVWSRQTTRYKPGITVFAETK